MTPEMVLARHLSTHRDVENLKSSYSTDELAAFVKKAGVKGIKKEAFLGGAANWIRSQAASALPKVIAGANKVGPSLGRAAGAVLGASNTTRGLTGAGIGAGMGAVRHMMKPKDPQTGQRRGSLLGSMTGGAVLGGTAGLAAGPALKRLADSKQGRDLFAGQYQYIRRPSQQSLNLGGASTDPNASVPFSRPAPRQTNLPLGVPAAQRQPPIRGLA